ncbi:MAG: hypothetical protein AXA67_05110 [Methylothermaceae bacteria B42]|nr:MAG: hypothetical protein AXA67_05110 [Methylothermaceae bacteria B42]HHJ39347.1 NHL domain/cytochrome c family protein [Methylothermaceae bacterium]
MQPAKKTIFLKINSLRLCGEPIPWLLFCLILLACTAVEAESLPVVTAKTPLPVTVSQPTAIATGPDQSLYLLDTHQQVLKIPANNKPRFLTGPGLLDHPLDLKWGESGLWVADTGNHRLLLFDAQGRMQRAFYPKPPSCPEEKPGCNRLPPEPVAVAEVDDILLWSDRRYHRVCRLRLPKGKPLDCFGGRGEEEGKFQFPFQIAIDRDKFPHVVDILNARIQIFDKDGRFFRQQGRFGFEAGELFRPNGLAMDKDRDRLFISDGYFGTITLFQEGEAAGVLKTSGGQPLYFDSPTGLAFDNGSLYVAETGAGKVWKLTLKEMDMPLPPKAGSTTVQASQKNCLLCHLEWAEEGPAAIKQPDQQGIMPVASFRMCYSCHNGPVMDSRTIINDGEQHPVIYEPEKDKQRHAKLWPRKDKLPDELFPITEDHQLTCATCHTPHEDTSSATLYQGHQNAWLGVPNPEGKLCERCHESKAKNARESNPKWRGRNHPMGIHLAKPPHRGASGYPSDPDLHHGLPTKLAELGGSLDKENRVICQSCHQIHGGVSQFLLLMNANRGQLCGQCHKRQFSRGKKEARRKGAHPVNIEPDEEMKRDGKKVKFVTCLSCHPVHEGKPGTPMLLKPTPGLCHDCHKRQHARDKDDALKKGVHPVNFDLEESVTLKGRNIKRVDCLTCHAVHKGKPNTPALVEDHHDGQLCRACHEDNIPVLGSDHDLRITAGDSQNRLEQTPAQSGLCGACHSLHRGEGKWPYLYASAMVDDPSRPSKEGEKSNFKRDQLCINCHQDNAKAVGKEKFIEYFSHPYQQIVLQSDKDKMPLLGKDGSDQAIGAIGCTTCHDPHVWQPDHWNKKQPPLAGNRKNLEGDPNSSFLRITKPTKTFCLNCHGKETRIKFLYFHHKSNARGKLNYLK